MGPSPIVDEICSSPAIKLTSFPLTIQENLIPYLTQHADSVTLISYTNCDECIRNNEPCLEQLTEESKINIQQDAYVKITTRAFKSQNEKGNNQVELSEMMICDSLRERMGITSQISDGGNYFHVSDEELGGTCYESLNHSSRIHVMKKKCRKKHCFSNQTKPDKTLVKPKTKFFRQSSERQKMFNYEEKNAELIRQDIVFVGPTEELQNTAIDQKSLMHEMSDNPKGNQHSSQGSTLHSTGCQVLPSEDSPFATYKDFEDSSTEKLNT
ncbi:uncharacterized protein LOC132391505 [Hypanus sabinus]|uniref:uncharacterized protein LOC132391505 n=1 Tax=Hypanus sabinus TaxID=79690 RepID=UPI0028C48A22|nr:uncharacterized protein LOC132391505 [Hypanus sabinus]